MNKNILDFLIPKNYEEPFLELYHEINLFGTSEILAHILEVYFNDINEKQIPFELKINVFRNLDNEINLIFNCRDVSEVLKLQNKQNRVIEDLYLTRAVIEQHANELIRLNDVISTSEEKLKELNSSKDRFFSIISHDLKNPFQTLIGYTDLLANKTQNFSLDEIQDISQSLNDTTKNVYKLLENLLEWSRLQKGSMPLNPEEFDLCYVVNGNIDIATPKSITKNITLVNNIPENIMVYADINMINTVIRNLISNALKFTDLNGQITINYLTENNNHIIEVSDNGLGMSENTKSKLFKIDENVTTLGTDSESGTGLGLILCKELINKNFGTITVESQLNKGTTFSIVIPKNLEVILSNKINKFNL